MKEAKKQLRASIRLLKKHYPPLQLTRWSSSLLSGLEDQTVFRQARTVLAYAALPDEVQTQEWIERWKDEKILLLPVVKGNELELRRYTGRQNLQTGAFGIKEPTGPLFSDYGQIDVALVPGMAFDTLGHRLGRGKGYYDRLLPQLTAAWRIGICFGFQIFPCVPTEPFDLSMHEVWTEEGRISIPTILPQQP